MLSSIAWSTYWMCIICLVPLYYLIVGFMYFREEISGLLKGGLPAKKKKTLSSIPASNKNSILSAASREEQQEAEEEDHEEEEENDSSQDEPQAGWKSVQAGNEQYAAVKETSAVKESNVVKENNVVKEGQVQLENPQVEKTSQAKVEHNPFTDIALESHTEEDQVIASIPLQTAASSRIFDIDMFFAFMDAQNSNEQIVSTTNGDASSVQEQDERQQNSEQTHEEQMILAQKEQTEGNQVSTPRLEIDVDDVEQEEFHSHPYKNQML